MNIYLDDVRTGPKGWLTVRTGEEAIKLLESRKVKMISLDHDLGLNIMSGYDVACWIEEQVFTNEDYQCPDIKVHSFNLPGRQRIQQVINHIETKLGRKEF
jgi:hypothetical protein